MQAIEGTEHKRNYYALYLAIIEEISPANAMRTMGISTHKADQLHNELSNDEKLQLWEENKEEIKEMRENGATYNEIAKEYKFYTKGTFMNCLKNDKEVGIESKTDKQEKFEQNKDEILQMRENGATYNEIAEKYDFYTSSMMGIKIREELKQKGATA